MNMIKRIEYLEELKRWKDKDLIKVVTGIRRCGKSTLFELFIEYLKEEKIDDKHIISINLESLEYDFSGYKELYDYVMKMVKDDKKYYVTDNYEVHALDGVSLSVEEGEFLAIIGTSGSGKTTLLQILGGLDEPTAGGVWIRGNSLKDMTEDERTIFRRRNIGFVFQQYNLIPVINVYENIVLPLRLDGAEIDEKLLEDIVRTLKIGEKLENLPEELSGGQQQRVAIARALMVKPAVLLCDEPTGNLDSVTSMEVISLLKTCAARFHQTVIVVTHQEAIAQMADRILRVEDGKLYNAEV